MGNGENKSGIRTVIGGRHGSPTLTIALPFSRISSDDTELRGAVADLATLVAHLATHAEPRNQKELNLVRSAAEELAARFV